MTFKISVITPTIRPDGLKVVQESLEKQTFTDFEWLVDIGLKTTPCDLNKAYNRLLSRAKGELVVSLQDYIKIRENGLQSFWEAYKQDKRTLFTAPVGKVKEFGDKPKYDWREHPEAKMTWKDWEIDWGAAPLKMFYDTGGLDEEFDKHWSGDNVSLGYRASQFGYKFKCLHENKAVAIDHDAKEEHPYRDKYNPEFINERIESYKFDPKLNYLVDTNY